MRTNKLFNFRTVLSQDTCISKICTFVRYLINTLSIIKIIIMS